MKTICTRIIPFNFGFASRGKDIDIDILIDMSLISGTSIKGPGIDPSGTKQRIGYIGLHCKVLSMVFNRLLFLIQTTIKA